MDRTSPLHAHAGGDWPADDPPRVDDAGEIPENPKTDVYPNICTAPALLEEYGNRREDYGHNT